MNRALRALLLAVAFMGGPAGCDFAPAAEAEKPPGHEQFFDPSKEPSGVHQIAALVCNEKDELVWAISHLDELQAAGKMRPDMDSDTGESEETPLDKINEHFKSAGEAECTADGMFVEDFDGNVSVMSPPVDGTIHVFDVHEVELVAIFIDGAGWVKLPHRVSQWVAEEVQSHPL